MSPRLAHLLAQDGVSWRSPIGALYLLAGCVAWFVVFVVWVVRGVVKRGHAD